MLQRQSRNLFNVLTKSGISAGSSFQQPPWRLPSTTINNTFRSCHQSHSKTQIRSTLSRVTPWILCVGVGTIGLKELYENTCQQEKSFLSKHFLASCAGEDDPQLEMFIKRHVLGKSLKEIENMIDSELDDLLKITMGDLYQVRGFNSFLLIDAATLNAKLEQEMDGIIDELGHERRPDQWVFSRIESDRNKTDVYNPQGPPKKIPTKYFWLPGEYDVLECYWNATKNSYTYTIGKGFKILVGIVEVTRPYPVEWVYRPNHLEGVAKYSFKQEREHELFPTFFAEKSTMIYIETTLDNLQVFCPKTKRIIVDAIQEEPKPSISPLTTSTPDPVPQHHRVSKSSPSYPSPRK